MTETRVYKKPTATREDKDLRDEKFVRLVSSGISTKEACIALGYAESAAESNGSKLKRRLQPRITEAAVERLQSAAIKSYQEIRKLALYSDSPSIRLKACIDLMDRGGYKAVAKVQQTTTTTTVSKTTEQLEEELADIMSTVGVTQDATGKVSFLPGVTQEDLEDDWVPLDNLSTVDDEPDESSQSGVGS